MFSFSKATQLVSNQAALRNRLHDVLAHDELYSRTELKNAVEPIQGLNNKANNNIVSLAPYLRRDTSNLGGDLA